METHKAVGHNFSNLTKLRTIFSELRVNAILCIAVLRASPEQATSLVNSIIEELASMTSFGTIFESKLKLLIPALKTCKANIDWKRLIQLLVDHIGNGVLVPQIFAIIASYRCTPQEMQYWMGIAKIAITKLSSADLALLLSFIVKAYPSITSLETAMNSYFIWLIVNHHLNKRDTKYVAMITKNKSYAIKIEYPMLLIMLNDYPALVQDKVGLLEGCLANLEPCMLPEPVLLGICKCLQWYPQLVQNHFVAVSNCLTRQHECYDTMIGSALATFQSKCSDEQWKALEHICPQESFAIVLALMNKASTLFKKNMPLFCDVAFLCK